MGFTDKIDNSYPAYLFHPLPTPGAWLSSKGWDPKGLTMGICHESSVSKSSERLWLRFRMAVACVDVEASGCTMLYPWWHMVAWDIWIYLCLFDRWKQVFQSFSIFSVMVGSSQKPPVDVSGMEQKKTRKSLANFPESINLGKSNRPAQQIFRFAYGVPKK